MNLLKGALFVSVALLMGGGISITYRLENLLTLLFPFVFVTIPFLVIWMITEDPKESVSV